MRSKTRRGAIVAAMLLVAVGVGADELAVVSTAPQGQLTGGEPGRVQVLFDRAMVPLSAAAVPGSRRTGSSSSRRSRRVGAGPAPRR